MNRMMIAIFLLTTSSALADVTFSGVPAKNVFDSLTGPAVTWDGGMGSTYLMGQSIVCRGPNDPDARMDPENYFCTIRFNSNGKILPPRR